jgi:hypothetical protein
MAEVQRRSGSSHIDPETNGTWLSGSGRSSSLHRGRLCLEILSWLRMKMRRPTVLLFPRTSPGWQSSETSRPVWNHDYHREIPKQQGYNQSKSCLALEVKKCIHEPQQKRTTSGFDARVAPRFSHSRLRGSQKDEEWLVLTEFAAYWLWMQFSQVGEQGVVNVRGLGGSYDRGGKEESGEIRRGVRFGKLV